ncbi:uncharacterized protein ARMOST_00024 [Armillaria ostoyae]|uniref:C2H2-type domain-containing protein n=1 Tax=Armillaria ostoyae TaxID=47428 RepID=A0A284QJZ2_ARMOS|nr:uncharacterized protein ARMOST_00024 [Armillaria ostoyae]
MPSSFTCNYCATAPFPTSAKLRWHQQQAPHCKQAHQRELQQHQDNYLRLHGVTVESSTSALAPSMEEVVDTSDMDIYPVWPVNVDSDNDPTVDDFDACALTSGTSLGVIIEDVSDEDDEKWHTSKYPDEQGAGAPISAAPKWTLFHCIHDDQILRGAEIWGPFADEDKWEMAKWLIKNVGHKATDEFLKLNMIATKARPSFHNKEQFLKTIDGLPTGVPWKLETLTLRGDLQDSEGKARTEELELWYRDPVECIRELLENPIFRDSMKYAPEHIVLDWHRKVEVINEMWTASWWWELQQILPPGATICPIILSSDKTQLSQFRGDKSAWPVYLTIGNIAKGTRREASSHATVLIGYLPVGKFDCYSDSAKQFAHYRVFNHCMNVVLTSVKEAGKTGITMTCSDERKLWIWPIVAAYVADYPEQCLVACCKENQCPLYQVGCNERGDNNPCLPRDAGQTLDMIQQHLSGISDTNFTKDWENSGIWGVPNPFWHDLPFSNIFEAFTPDLLHQLHKGVFKDHLVKWCMNLVGEDEIDKRFKAMSGHPGLRHFKTGLSSISQ